MVGECRPDGVAANLAQADMGAIHGGDGPWKTPAIVVKHRQCPEVYGMFRNRRRNNIALGEKTGTAMMIDHPLGITSGSRGVIDGNGVPLVLRYGPGKVGVAAGQRGLVLVVT